MQIFTHALQRAVTHSRDVYAGSYIIQELHQHTAGAFARQK